MKPNLVANKACAARVRKREQEMLKSRIKNVKPQIDTRPPDSMALDHVRNNLKREQLLEERYHAIDRDNRILLQKMSDIMKTPSVKSGLGAQSSPAINTRDARKAELSRITQENLAILKRIQQAQPVYNHVEWDDSYRRTVERCKSSAARRAHRFGGMPFEFELPSKPVLVAGGFGGPAVMFLVTPFRNGLTLGATSPASAVELYQQVFAQGFARGWTGGAFTARAACPQFLCLGPAYHFYASFSGVGGGVLLTSLTETLIVYGAETKNAQMATNQKSPGSITSVHPSWKPFGPGFGIHVFRNVIATAGLRMFCSPCRTAIEKATGNSNSMTTLAGDFAGNVCAACLSAPVHQLYGYTVTTPELRTLPAAEQRERMVSFLKNQYLDTSNGRTRLSGLVPRDLFMRSMYVAVAYTMYSTVERTLVANWNSCEYPLTLTKKKVPTRSSSLTPLSGKANKGMATTTGSLGALAPGEVGQESAGDDLRYVLKEGKDINGVFYLCEMATDGRSLAITAYDAEQKTTLELLVNEKNHRRLYRDHNGDYRAIAAKLCLDGEQLYINHDGMLPDGKPEREEDKDTITIGQHKGLQSGGKGLKPLPVKIGGAGKPATAKRTRIDTNFMLFMDVMSEGVYELMKKWHEKFTVKKEQLQCCINIGWMAEGATKMNPYYRWNREARTQVYPAVPFLLPLSLRQSQAGECHEALMELEQAYLAAQYSDEQAEDPK
ncbi:Cfap97d1 [Symbiodinium sp. KB8]|nr:Cfap97d1 [Symbiodinium sp. KB8]